MRIAAACLLAFLVAGTAPSDAARRSTLRVAAAASLAGPFGDLARRFERAHPGIAVRLELAGSQQLAAQLEHGAPADVFASADRRWMEHVVARDLVDGAPVVFARNQLVVVLPRANRARVAGLADLARPGLRLVIAAEAVPAGRYAREALRRLAALPGHGPDFERRALANVVSEEENVKAVAAKVRLGEADAGIVYRSDAGPELAPHVRTLPIPGEASPAVEYPIARLKGGGARDAARDFVALVLSREGQAVLARHGFVPAGSAP